MLVFSVFIICVFYLRRDGNLLILGNEFIESAILKVFFGADFEIAEGLGFVLAVVVHIHSETQVAVLQSGIKGYLPFPFRGCRP